MAPLCKSRCTPPAENFPLLSVVELRFHSGGMFRNSETPRMSGSRPSDMPGAVQMPKGGSLMRHAGLTDQIGSRSSSSQQLSALSVRVKIRAESSGYLF